MAPIKIVNPVYSGQQEHVDVGQNKVEDQIKNPIPVNQGHEQYGAPGVKLQGSVSRDGGRMADEAENHRLVHGVGYVLPAGAQYGGIPQTGLVRQRGQVYGQIPPRFGLGVQKMEYPEQWYRNSTSTLPDPAKIKKEIEAMMASFGLKAFNDAPSSTSVTPTPPINPAPASSQNVAQFYQEYPGGPGGPHPKRARPNPKIEASPLPRDRGGPSQQSYTSSVPHMQVSPPPQRDASHIPPHQVSSSYQGYGSLNPQEQVNSPQQQDPLQHHETGSPNPQVSPSQQVYISPPPQEYVAHSPPPSQEYVTPSPQEYVNPLSQEYVSDHSPSQHVGQYEESSLNIASSEFSYKSPIPPSITPTPTPSPNVTTSSQTADKYQIADT